MQFVSWSGSEIGLVRKVNEDSIGCFPELGLFVVADGMGGLANGAVASRMAVETLHAGLVDHSAHGDAAEEPTYGGSVASVSRPTSSTRYHDDARRLVAVVELANERILEANKAESGDPSLAMGTTVVALQCLPERNRVTWAHVGDSRLYRLRADRIELLTADHTRFGSQYLNANKVPVDLPHTNRLLQALGIRDEIAVTTGNDLVRDHDLFLLCSDGISGLVSTATLHSIFAQEHLADAGQSLIQAALAAGGKDNASLIIVRILRG